MAITYPLALPNTSFKGARWVPKAVVGVSQSPFTLAEQVQVFAGQQWAFDVMLPPMVRADAEAWRCFFLKLNGREGTFLMGDPQCGTPRGPMGGTPLVNGASQTGNTLVIDGATPSITGWALAGDYLQLGSGSTARLHKILDDADSDGSGNVSLTIWPKLRESPADNDPLTVTNTVGIFRMLSNEMPFDINEAVLYGASFACAEALP